jgi:hypothetical protein
VDDQQVWVQMVQAQRGYTVDCRFMSLRMINAAVDHDSHFPPGYEAGHTAGLKLLRGRPHSGRARSRRGLGAVRGFGRADLRHSRRFRLA